MSRMTMEPMKAALMLGVAAGMPKTLARWCWKWYLMYPRGIPSPGRYLTALQQAGMENGNSLGRNSLWLGTKFNIWRDLARNGMTDGKTGGFAHKSPNVG